MDDVLYCPDMSRTLMARASAGVLLLMGCWIAYTQNQKAPAKLTLNKIKEDLYEIEGDGGNVAVYVTSEGVILIDDKFEQDHEGIMERSRASPASRSNTSLLRIIIPTIAAAM